MHGAEEQLQVSDRVGTLLRQPTERQTRGRAMVEWKLWGRLLVKRKEIHDQRPRHPSPSAGVDVDEAAQSWYI